MALLEVDDVTEAIDRLVARTAENRQTWELLAGDVYATHTNKFSYFIESRDGDGEAPFKFEIYRLVPPKDGVQQDSIRVGELETARATQGSVAGARNRKLARLYAAARAAAMGIAGLRDDLLSDLD